MAVIPLIPALSLGLLSFLSSVTILVRILFPIFPSSPFSKPTISTQSRLRDQGNVYAADIAHAWLALFDIVSLVAFLAQVFCQYQDNAIAFDAASSASAAARFWIALTARQSALLVILSINLLYIRLGRPISFGIKHIYFWLPATFMVGTGTIAAALLTKAGYNSFFGGIAAYISVISILSTSLLAFLVVILLRILRNLENDRLASEIDSWPALDERKRRKSVTTDELHAIKDRSSWLTSVEGSIRKSMSAWSFTTSNTNATKSKHVSRHSFPISVTSHTPSSILSDPRAVKTTFVYSVPPVPPLPSPYKSTPPEFVGRGPSPSGSTNSWLTSPSGTRETMSSFSFPTTRATSRATTTSRLTARNKLPTTTTTVVFPVSLHVKSSHSSINNDDSGLHSLALTGEPMNHKVTFIRVLLWAAMVWLPYAFMMPYISLAKSGYHPTSPALGILLTIAVCISSPLLALALYFTVALPIPSNLFTNKPKPAPPVQVFRKPPKESQAISALPAPRRCSELRVRGKSGSYTVVEGRRSGDVWIENGQAVDGRSRAARVLSLLAPYPKLSVLPPRDEEAIIDTTKSNNQRESIRTRSTQTNALLDEDVDEVAVAPQRPRGRAETPSSAEDYDGYSMEVHGPSVDRAQSPSLYQRVIGPSLSPPPTIPLPPLPVDIKHDQEEPSLPHTIDSLSAGILPFLVPGLAIGDSQSIEPYTPAPQRVLKKARSSDWHRPKKPVSPSSVSDSPESGTGRSGSSFASPEDCSTPRLYGSNSRAYQSLPSIGKTSSLATAQAVQEDGFIPSDEHIEHNYESTVAPVLPLLAEEDTLTRKLNSLIRSLSSPPMSTPSSYNSKGGQSTKTASFDKENSPPGIVSAKPENLPVVEPLAPRRLAGARRKPKARRYSPFNASPRVSPRKATSIKVPNARDSKVLYKVKRHSLAHSVQAPRSNAATFGESMVVSSLDHQARTDHAPSPLDAHASTGLRIPMLQINVNEVSRPINEPRKPNSVKENLGSQRLKVAANHLARSDTARRRSRLMQNQQLPTVVVRPPSGASVGEHSATVWLPSFSDAL